MPSRARATFLAVASLVACVGGITAAVAVKATNWAVMTDELQTVRIATSIAERFVPIPSIHGRYYGALSVLYPTLIAPFFGFLSAPTAIAAAHALNAFLLASAAIPAYLVAWSITESRLASLFAAALTAVTPWLVLSSTLLTENAAYPAFAWAVYLCHRSLVEPTPGRDLAALGGLLLAYFARTQLFIVALVFPLAVFLHELGFVGARARGEATLRLLRAAARRSVQSHRVALAAYGAFGAAAIALAAAGSLGTIFGNYAITLRGTLFRNGILSAGAVHFDQIVVAGGVVPFLLAAAWAAVTLARPESKQAHAFAILLILLVPLLTFEVASFDLRFASGAFAQDRYLFYLAPLLAVGSAAALARRTHTRVHALLVLIFGAAFVWLAGFATYTATSIFWAAPAAAFNPALTTVARWFGHSEISLVRAAAVVIALGLVAALLRAPRVALTVVVGVVLVAYGAFQAGYVFKRSALPFTTRPSKFGAVRDDWIDALPHSASVALLPSGSADSSFWWDAELWNKDVDRLLRVGKGPTYTHFPADQLQLDFATGQLRGRAPTDLVVETSADTRLHLLVVRLLRKVGPLEVVQVSRPYRADWATRGATADGWTRPGRAVRLRVYDVGRARARTVFVTLSVRPTAKAPARVALSGSGMRINRELAPGASTLVRVRFCVPRGGFADLVLLGKRSVHLDEIKALQPVENLGCHS